MIINISTFSDECACRNKNDDNKNKNETVYSMHIHWCWLNSVQWTQIDERWIFREFSKTSDCWREFSTKTIIVFSWLSNIWQLISCLGQMRERSARGDVSIRCGSQFCVACLQDRMEVSTWRCHYLLSCKRTHKDGALPGSREMGDSRDILLFRLSLPLLRETDNWDWKLRCRLSNI